MEPFGAQLQSVEGDRVVYRVNGSPEQVRAQLSLAKLAEVSPGEAQAPAQPAVEGAVAAPIPQLRFRW